MNPVVFSVEAREDLDAALYFLARRRPRAAARLLTKIDAAIELLSEGSTEGRPAVLTSGERVFRWVVGAYIVYYQRRDGVLCIVRIHHGKRAPLEF